VCVDAVTACARGRGRGGRWARSRRAAVAVAAPHAPAAQTAGRRAPVRSRRGPGSCGAAAPPPRGCPPGARDRRAQPNVMGHGHVRDGGLGGLFHGLLRGVGGSGEENGGLHGPGVLTGCYLTGSHGGKR